MDARNKQIVLNERGRLIALLLKAMKRGDYVTALSTGARIRALSVRTGLSG